MQVSEVMHKGVFTVQISDTIKKVAALMKRENIGSVPVYKNERPVGFVTDRDIVISSIAQGHSAEETISSAMTRDIICVKESDDINRAAKLMSDNQISRLLVLDNGENPVGMLTLRDIARSSEDKEFTALTLEKIKRS